jgi:hypothetical protein
MRNLEFRSAASVRPNGFFYEVPGQSDNAAEPLSIKESAAKSM